MMNLPATKHRTCPARRLWPVLLLLAGSAVAADDYAIDDAYLQSLSAEADQLEYMSGAEAELKASESEEQSERQSPAALARLQQALQGTAHFEQVLGADYPYSYQLYRKLTAAGRRQAFETLRQSRRFSEVKRVIIETYRRQLDGL